MRRLRRIRQGGFGQPIALRDGQTYEIEIMVGNYNLLGFSETNFLREVLEILDVIIAFLFGLVYLAADQKINGKRKYHLFIYLVITCPSLLLSISNASNFIQRKKFDSIDDHCEGFEWLSCFASKKYAPLPFYLGCIIAFTCTYFSRPISTANRRFFGYLFLFIISVTPPVLFFLAYKNLNVLITAASLRDQWDQRDLGNQWEWNPFDNTTLLDSFNYCVESQSISTLINLMARSLWARHRREFLLFSMIPGVHVLLLIAAVKIRNKIRILRNPNFSTNNFLIFKLGQWVGLLLTMLLAFPVTVSQVGVENFIWPNSSANISLYLDYSPFKINVDAFAPAIFGCLNLNFGPLGANDSYIYEYFVGYFHKSQMSSFYHIFEYERRNNAMYYQMHMWDSLPILFLFFFYHCWRIISVQST